MPENVFTKDAGSFVKRKDAKLAIDTYKKSENIKSNGNIKAHFYGANKMNQLLSQDGCVGVRIWYGQDVDSENKVVPQLYIVGVDEKGNDILLPAGNELILDNGLACPWYCPGVEGDSLDL
ncbi:MAG: hypothetical protein KA010_02940 [Saprospiraceae bacterium]|nr:hypothetical protein [Saprospiraceae bacterium]